jgi:hypothetical protein
VTLDPAVAKAGAGRRRGKRLRHCLKSLKGYFRTLAQRMGKSQSLNGLGQAAIQTTDGSIIVRKDWKVLLVNAAGLPAEFGQPPTSSRAAAESVADVILGCWDGD